MSDRKSNPSDWNRGHTTGSGRSRVMFWIGMAFVVIIMVTGVWSMLGQ
jgi:hypothetical protein